MKNKFLIFILLCSLSNVYTTIAQHKLETERNSYRAANQIEKQQVEYKDPGSTGRDLYWDFSFLQNKNYNYPINYFIPDSVDMTRLCGMEHNTRYYYQQKTDTLLAVGYENSTTYMEYIKPELRMHFPFQYGDTLYSEFEGVGEYCHRLALSVKGYTRIVADAVGELLLPGNNKVTKALRVHTLRHYTETMHEPTEITHEIYSWYAAGVRYPVFESIKTTRLKTSNQNDTVVFTTSFYYPPEQQIQQIDDDYTESFVEETLSGIEAVFTEAELMPNPVSSTLTINYKLTRPAQVWFSIHNNAGVPVRQTTVLNQSEGYQNTSINMSQLMTGTYTLYVHVDDMVMQRVVVKN